MNSIFWIVTRAKKRFEENKQINCWICWLICDDICHKESFLNVFSSLPIFCNFIFNSFSSETVIVVGLSENLIYLFHLNFFWTKTKTSFSNNFIIYSYSMELDDYISIVSISDVFHIHLIKSSKTPQVLHNNYKLITAVQQ